jgi:hypothetical protein
LGEVQADFRAIPVVLVLDSRAAAVTPVRILPDSAVLPVAVFGLVQEAVADLGVVVVSAAVEEADVFLARVVAAVDSLVGEVLVPVVDQVLVDAVSSSVDVEVRKDARQCLAIVRAADNRDFAGPLPTLSATRRWMPGRSL